MHKEGLNFFRSLQADVRKELRNEQLKEESFHSTLKHVLKRFLVSEIEKQLCYTLYLTLGQH